MPAPLRRPMTSDEFILWAMAQPEGERYELVNGEVVGMSPERLVHAEVKGLVWLALRTALAAAGRLCVAYPDGVSVQVDAEHDLPARRAGAVRRPAAGGDDQAQRSRDRGRGGLAVVRRTRHWVRSSRTISGCTSVRHYLIVRTDRGSVIHHERRQDGGIVTRMVREVVLELDPPGIEVPVAAFFP